MADEDVRPAPHDPDAPHPASAGVGAASTGLAAAVAGAVLGGPVGAVLGGVGGAVAGGLAGQAVAQGVHPGFEEDYWRTRFGEGPNAEAYHYETYRPAYRYGWDARLHHPGRSFEQVEGDLETAWDEPSGLAWNDVKEAVREAWNRAEERPVIRDSDRQSG
jgi:hypothetical protein